MIDKNLWCYLETISICLLDQLFNLNSLCISYYCPFTLVYYLYIYIYIYIYIYYYPFIHNFILGMTNKRVKPNHHQEQLLPWPNHNQDNTWFVHWGIKVELNWEINVMSMPISFYISLSSCHWGKPYLFLKLFEWINISIVMQHFVSFKSDPSHWFQKKKKKKERKDPSHWFS